MSDTKIVVKKMGITKEQLFSKGILDGNLSDQCKTGAIESLN